ncbi:MAG: universal stress protein [Natronomonas sp.]
MFETILIPTDGSEPAQHAAVKGIELAAEQGATVHAMYAVEPIPLGGISAGPEPASAEFGSVIEEQKAEGEKALKAVRQEANEHGVDVVEAIEYGDPDEEILEYAEKEDVDAIVMGTHGRSGAGRLVIGSVAEKVVRKSPIPVLTIRMAE